MSWSLPHPVLPDFQAWVFELEPVVPPGAEKLIELLEKRLRENAPRVPRAADEKLQPGDEVECCLLPSHQGRFLVGSLLHRVDFRVENIPALPGLLEALLEMQAQGDYEIVLQLGPDYPVEELAGQELAVLVRLGAACQVLTPDWEDPAALQASGLGENLDQAMEILAEQFDHDQARETLEEMSQRVLERLAEEVEFELPEELVSDELSAAFRRRIRPLLLEMGLEEAEVETSHQDYLRQAEARLEAEFRIRCSVALLAVQEAWKVPLDQDIVGQLEEQAAAGMGLEHPQWFALFDQEEQSQRLLRDFAQRLSNLQFVISQVQFREPED